MPPVVVCGQLFDEAAWGQNGHQCLHRMSNHNNTSNGNSNSISFLLTCAQGGYFTFSLVIAIVYVFRTEGASLSSCCTFQPQLTRTKKPNNNSNHNNTSNGNNNKQYLQVTNAALTTMHQMLACRPQFCRFIFADIHFS